MSSHRAVPDHVKGVSNGAGTAHRHKPLHTDSFAHPHRNVGAFGLRHGMRAADFGSGSGAYVIAMAKAVGTTGHVYAVDVQRDLLRRTQNEAHKHRLQNVGVIWADIERPGASKIADRALDLVLISNLLFQIDDRSGVLREGKRILKPDGRLILIDWSDSYRNLGPHKDEVVTKEEAFALARKSGFDLEKEFRAGAHHYGLIFKPTKEL